MSEPAPNLRERQKAQTRALIIEAMVTALSAGEAEQLTHDALARRTGVSRQTVYRHFPDRDALMAALWEEVNPRFTARGLPTTEADLTDLLRPMYTAFDDNAEIVAVAQGTPQGRAMRLAVKDRRTAAFRQATATAAAGLSEHDRTLAAAVIQLLHGGQAWMEMRQQWGLGGEDVAGACDWAIRTLLADLHARKGRPLSE